MNVEQVAVELARESAADQGLPEFIEDSETLLRVAAILAPSEEAERRASADAKGGEADEDSDGRRTA